jgi:DsrE/DsrF/DrsH-like family
MSGEDSSARVAQLEARITALEERLATVEPDDGRVTLLAHSGEFDKLMSVFIIATGAATMALDVSIFFTFWGLTALKRTTSYAGKPLS